MSELLRVNFAMNFHTKSHFAGLEFIFFLVFLSICSVLPMYISLKVLRGRVTGQYLCGPSTVAFMPPKKKSFFVRLSPRCTYLQAFCLVYHINCLPAILIAIICSCVPKSQGCFSSFTQGKRKKGRKKSNHKHRPCPKSVLSTTLTTHCVVCPNRTTNCVVCTNRTTNCVVCTNRTTNCVVCTNRTTNCVCTNRTTNCVVCTNRTTNCVVCTNCTTY
jgi:hypothetical protein